MSGDVLGKVYGSPNPALNVACRNNAVATDRVFSDTPVVNNGATKAALFVGREALVADVLYPLKTAKQVNFLAHWRITSHKGEQWIL